jgi:hypothetical protein
MFAILITPDNRHEIVTIPDSDLEQHIANYVTTTSDVNDVESFRIATNTLIWLNRNGLNEGLPENGFVSLLQEATYGYGGLVGNAILTSDRVHEDGTLGMTEKQAQQLTAVFNDYVQSLDSE